MTRFVGVCLGQGVGSQWGDEDQLGYLLAEEEDGWYVEGTHLSSSVVFAEGDIGRKFERVKRAGDTYEWVGRLSADEVSSRFPPGRVLKRETT